MSKASINKLQSVLVTALQGLKFPAQLPDGSGASPFAGQIIFSPASVKAFDLIDLASAFEELLVFSDRAAFVVLNQEEQKAETKGMDMVVSFHDSFTILMSDRSYKNRQLALTGDAKTPGVNLLADTVLRLIMGELAPGYVCEPQGGELFALTGETRDDLIGRVGWRQNVKLHGGREIRQLSRLALTTFTP